MALFGLNEVCAGRRPFVLFVFVSALLFLAFVLLFPAAPYPIWLFCMLILAGEWFDVLKARLSTVGLPHSRRTMFAYALLVCAVFELLFHFAPHARLLAPGVFVLLNIPLVILKDKPQVQD